MATMSNTSLNPVGDDCWLQLDAEFDAWQAAGRVASLWWRDDDATVPGPRLDRLLQLTSATGLLLAVIPALADQSLATALAGCSHVRVAQHGYAHKNYAERGQGQGAWELGMHRGEAAVLADLDNGRKHLQDLFGISFMPVVVPPWNHLAAELLEPIAERAYAGVSAFGPRDSTGQPSGLIMVNAHCDPIRWKEGARFRGESKTINQLVDHLHARRHARVDADEPTGFLTHHKDLDAPAWAFCEQLASRVADHPGATWLSPVDVFGTRT